MQQILFSPHRQSLIIHNVKILWLSLFLQLVLLSEASFPFLHGLDEWEAFEKGVQFLRADVKNVDTVTFAFAKVNLPSRNPWWSW